MIGETIRQKDSKLPEEPHKLLRHETADFESIMEAENYDEISR